MGEQGQPLGSYIHTCTYTRMHMHAYICSHTYMCMRMGIHIYRHTPSEPQPTCHAHPFSQGAEGTLALGTPSPGVSAGGPAPPHVGEPGTQEGRMQRALRLSVPVDDAEALVLAAQETSLWCLWDFPEGPRLRRDRK